MIIGFRNEDEYKRWLAWQSWNVKQKATKFHEVFGNVIPIVIVADVDTSQTGESAAAHIFLHSKAEELLKWVVVD